MRGYEEMMVHDTDSGRMSFARQRMVDSQLGRRGITDPRVLAAMGDVPREEFVPADVREMAYEDRALPIGHGQTISQPYTVAFMCEALALEGGEKVLEIGTGSGYAAAVLSRLAREVHTLERIPELWEEAQARLERLGYSNVQTYLANGTLGLPAQAPFDAIVVTAGAEQLPAPLREQLAEGGRIVIPLGDTPHSQSMMRFTLRSGQWQAEDLGSFAFVPLIGQLGWSECAS
jgi:protein-L-isoaspartate(D-aspartate) O-methyltransferase